MEPAVPVGLQPHQADTTPPPAVQACGHQLPSDTGPLRIRVDGQRPEPAERAPRHRDQRPHHPPRLLLPHGNEAPARIRGKPHSEEQRRDPQIRQARAPAAGTPSAPNAAFITDETPGSSPEVIARTTLTLIAVSSS